MPRLPPYLVRPDLLNTMTATPDRQKTSFLFSRMCAGDREAVNSLCTKIRPCLEAVAIRTIDRRLASASDYEDIVQTVLSDFVTKRHALKCPDGAGLRRYLCRMVRNKCIDALRRNRLGPQQCNGNGNRSTAIVEPVYSNSGFHRTDHSDFLATIAESLDEEEHPFFTLRVIQEIDYSQIATILWPDNPPSEGALRLKLFRIRRKLESNTKVMKYCRDVGIDLAFDVE